MKKIICLSMIMTIIGTGAVFADGNNQAQIDAVTGPGVGLAENSGNTSIIYGYGNLMTGITGNAIVEANANETSPTSVESNIINPINNYEIDMGPTSNYTAVNYIEHSINDGGPGTGITINVYGDPLVYGGGPGIGLAMASDDGGPSVVYQNVTPDDYLKMYNMTPKEASTEIIINTRKKKNNNENK